MLCVLIGPIENLNLSNICQKQNDVKKLAVPRIGCGLDGLQWDKVKDQLNEVFNGEPIEIVVWNYVP